MRTHYTSLFTVLMALFLVSSTSGCRSNGGAWYNPTSYSFSNPFSKDTLAKDSLAPLFGSSDNLANTKPSLNAQANIDTPQGGYSNRSVEASTGTASLTPPDHWGHHQSQMSAQQSMQNTMAGGMHSSGLPGLQNNQFVAESSQHLPYGDMYPAQQVPMQHGQIPGHSQGHNSMQYQPEFAQHTDHAVPFPYHATAFQHSANPANHNAMNPGGMGHQGQNMPHTSPFGVVPQSDPFSVAQQPGTVPPSSFGHSPAMPAPAQHQPHHGMPQQSPHQGQGFGAVDNFSAPSPSSYQPYSLPPSGGHYGF